jgi:hypothetical protein
MYPGRFDSSDGMYAMALAFVPWVYFVGAGVVSVLVARIATTRINAVGIFIAVFGILIVPVWHYGRSVIGMYGPQRDFISLPASVRSAEYVEMAEKVMTPEAFARYQSECASGEQNAAFWKALGDETMSYFGPSASGPLLRYPATFERMSMLHALMGEHFQSVVRATGLGPTDAYELRCKLDTHYDRALQVLCKPVMDRLAPAGGPPSAPSVAVRPVLLPTPAPPAEMEIPHSSVLRSGQVALAGTNVVITDLQGRRTLRSLLSFSREEQAWVRRNAATGN